MSGVNKGGLAQTPGLGVCDPERTSILQCRTQRLDRISAPAEGKRPVRACGGATHQTSDFGNLRSRRGEDWKAAIGARCEEWESAYGVRDTGYGTRVTAGLGGKSPRSEKSLTVATCWWNGMAGREKPAARKWLTVMAARGAGKEVTFAIADRKAAHSCAYKPKYSCSS